MISSRAHDAGSTLARYLVAGRHVDDVQGQVRELRAEGRRKIVPAALNDDQVQVGKAPIKSSMAARSSRRPRGMGRVRTAAGLHADDAFGRQRLAADEKLGVFARINVVSPLRRRCSATQPLAQGVDEARSCPKPTGPPTPRRNTLDPSTRTPQVQDGKSPRDRCHTSIARSLANHTGSRFPPALRVRSPCRMHPS